MKTFSGKFVPKNIKKYKGDYTNIVFRSSWEFSVMRWCDDNPSVKYWSSEETIVPYICSTDNKMHRYFMDFKIEYESGMIVLVEVKPAIQTKPPVIKKGKRQSTILNECLTYSKNVSKWKAATEYCKERGWSFQIWDETVLKHLGIKMFK